MKSAHLDQIADAQENFQLAGRFEKQTPFHAALEHDGATEIEGSKAAPGRRASFFTPKHGENGVDLAIATL